MAINPYGDFNFSSMLQGVNIPQYQYQAPTAPIPAPTQPSTPSQPAQPSQPPQPPQPPSNTSPTRTAPQTTAPASAPPPSSAQQWNAQPAPAPAQPAAAPAPTWKNMEDSWINFLGTQGLQQTRPGFFAMGNRSVPEMVDLYNKYTNQQATFVGGPSGDLVDFHDGSGPRDVKTANNEFWFSEPGQVGGAAPRPVGAAGGAGGAPPMIVSPNTGGGPKVTPTTDPTVQKLIDLLMARSSQSLQLDPNDPIIKGQADAYNADLERQRQRYLRDAAEQAGPYGSISEQARLTAENVGQQSAAQRAGLMGQELAARRQEIQNALGGAAGLLTSQQQMALQKELAMIDDATKRLSISTNAGLQQQGLNQDWQRALLQNEQFMANLGLNAEDRAKYWEAVNNGLIGG